MGVLVYIIGLISLNKANNVSWEFWYTSSSDTALDFIADFTNLLRALDRSKTICYLMGDFNIDLMKCDSGPITNY